MKCFLKVLYMKVSYPKWFTLDHKIAFFFPL